MSGILCGKLPRCRGFPGRGKGEGRTEAVPGEAGEHAQAAHADGNDRCIRVFLPGEGGGPEKGAHIKGGLREDGNFQDVSAELLHAVIAGKEIFLFHGAGEAVEAGENGNVLRFRQREKAHRGHDGVAVFNIEDICFPDFQNFPEERPVSVLPDGECAALGLCADRGQENGVGEIGAEDGEALLQGFLRIEVFHAQKAVNAPFDHVKGEAAEIFAVTPKLLRTAGGEGNADLRDALSQFHVSDFHRLFLSQSRETPFRMSRPFSVTSTRSSMRTPKLPGR